MARSAFESVVQVALDKYGPEKAKQLHIAIARKKLGELMARQQSKPSYTIETDGRPAASEESVRPFGVITYRFTRMREIAAFCLAEAIRVSPEASGRYKRSWFILADGAETKADAIPPSAKMILVVNDQPYSRKINVGAEGFEKYVPPGIAEKVRQAAIRKFRAVATIEVEYVTLSGGYVFKTNPKPAKAKQNRMSSAFRAGRATRRGRVMAGKAMTYPAVSIRPRF